MTKLLHSPSAKRLTIQGLMALTLLGIAATLIVTNLDNGNPVEAAQAEAVSEGLDMTTYGNVDAVRRAAGLESKSLAALGMDEAEATAVLTRLVSWCEANEKSLADTKQTVYRAERELHQQQRLVRIGQATARQLSDADGKAQAVKDAKQAHDKLMKSGAAYAMQGAPSKADGWERALSLKDQATTDLRYVSTLDARRLGELHSDAKRQKVAMEKQLSYGEQRELKAVRERITTSIPAVRAAEETALPLPLELRVPVEGDLIEEPAEEK